MTESARRDPDGSTIEYDEVPVAGDLVERLLRELFGEHWSDLTVGPIVEGAAYEIRFATPPTLSMLDGYLTVDTGAWHFHLCVGDHRAAPAPLAKVRRVGRAAFFRSADGTCLPMTWGLRLWNGRGDQMITIFFPNPYYDERADTRQPADWNKTALWESFRQRYTAPPVVSAS